MEANFRTLRSVLFAGLLSLMPSGLAQAQDGESSGPAYNAMAVFGCPEDPDGTGQSQLYGVSIYQMEYSGQIINVAQAVPEVCNPVLAEDVEAQRRALREAKEYRAAKGMSVKREVKLAIDPRFIMSVSPAGTSHSGSYSTIHFANGIPYDLLVGVFVHELMHIWRVENKKYKGRQPGDLEEGSCQYMGWIYFVDQGEEANRYWMDMTEGAPDSTIPHQVGLRKVRGILDKGEYTLDDLLYAISRGLTWEQFEAKLAEAKAVRGAVEGQ